MQKDLAWILDSNAGSELSRLELDDHSIRFGYDSFSFEYSLLMPNRYSDHRGRGSRNDDQRRFPAASLQQTCDYDQAEKHSNHLSAPLLHSYSGDRYRPDKSISTPSFEPFDNFTNSRLHSQPQPSRRHDQARLLDQDRRAEMPPQARNTLVPAFSHGRSSASTAARKNHGPNPFADVKGIQSKIANHDRPAADHNGTNRDKSGVTSVGGKLNSFDIGSTRAPLPQGHRPAVHGKRRRDEEFNEMLGEMNAKKPRTELRPHG